MSRVDFYFFPSIIIQDADQRRVAPRQPFVYAYFTDTIDKIQHISQFFRIVLFGLDFSVKCCNIGNVQHLVVYFLF